MSVAYALSGDAHAARADVPGAVTGGWFRLRRPNGRMLTWAVVDCPSRGQVTVWPSRQQCDAAEFGRATVLPAVEFAAVASPVEALR